jgi:hypothetical protein
LPRFGEIQPLAHLFKQRQPYSFAQLLDLHGNRGLGQVELFGSAGKAQVAGGNLEDLQLMQGNGLHGQSRKVKGLLLNHKR